MLVAIAGSSGLIGSALVASLTADGHQVLRLLRPGSGARDRSRAPGRGGGPGPGPGARDRSAARWDPAGGTIDARALAEADAVVNLAGRSVGPGRWTERRKREIYASRVDSTRLLAETMAGLDGGPRVLVCASGVNWYGSRGDEVLTEASAPGESGFMAGLARDWEAAADPARAAGIRTVHVRTGVVQAAHGGTLPIQVKLFRLGVGGRLGSGRQWWSWITLDDVVGVYRHAIATGSVQGALNATTPNPVTNAEFTATLARVLRRPALLPVPAFGPRLLLGEVADELLFFSARVLPAATEASGYRFRDPDLEPALRRLLVGRRP